MADTQDDRSYMEALTQEAVGHLKVIRKYLAWIAFVIVVTFAMSALGIVLTFAS